jgi:hypothetical protein
MKLAFTTVYSHIFAHLSIYSQLPLHIQGKKNIRRMPLSPKSCKKYIVDNSIAYNNKTSEPPLNLDTCRSSQPHHAIANEEHPKRFPGRCSLAFYFLHSARISKGERSFLSIKVT